MLSNVRAKYASFGGSVRCYWYKKHYQPPNVEPGKFPLPKKQLPSRAVRSFKERKEELCPPLADPLTSSINIGLPWTDEPLSQKHYSKREDLEASARHRTLRLNLEQVHDSWVQAQDGIKTRYQAALHYGIYADLFDGIHLAAQEESKESLTDLENPRSISNLAQRHCIGRSPLHFFMPVTPLSITFGKTQSQSVYIGNKLSSSTTMIKPAVTFPMEKGQCYTYLMTCPDGALHRPLTENLHQLVTNISTANPQGDEIVPYFQPIPFQGTGYHRYIYLLFQHPKTLNLAEMRRPAIKHLEERQFSTYDFYRRHQDEITPVGLGFFQASWDVTVREFFHKVLDLDEPVFEFAWPRPYLPPQEKFPQSESFNKYLDRYRDVHDLQEEVLKERLKKVHPFREDTPPLPYPNVVPLPRDMPMWLKDKIQEQRGKRGIWKDLDPS